MKRSPTFSIFLLAGVIALGICLCAWSNVFAQTSPNLAAEVNGRRISLGEVDESILPQVFALQQQIHAIRRVALDNLISRVLLEEEARKKGISVEELKQQLTDGKIEVAAAQVDQLYLENAATFGGMSPDEAKLRLRFDLESQARMKQYREALAKLREKARLVWLLDEPRLPPTNTSNTSSVGPKEAQVTIVEFADFQCPFCRESQSVIKQILQLYKSEVRMFFKQLPLESHSQAFVSAQASYCAGEQEAFWQYHDALFVADDLSAPALTKLAADLRLNSAKFAECLNSDRARVAVQNDLNEAMRLGINSTPTFIINGRLIRGAPSFEEFKRVIEQELSSPKKQ